jgi:hypothetical protein
MTCDDVLENSDDNIKKTRENGPDYMLLGHEERLKRRCKAKVVLQRREAMKKRAVVIEG